ncbi:hypothetical protein NPIL_218451, partial [Nephila pilipes]
MSTFHCLGLGLRKRQSPDVALFECLHKQICECKLGSRMQECYSYLTEE